MEQLLEQTASYVALAAQAIAVLVVAAGVLEALASGVRLALRGGGSDVERRAVWLGLARWLVAALTFQLAGDIVETTVAPTWDDIGRLAAIAALRTFLTYFLDRDIDSIRERGELGERRAGSF